MDPKAVEHLRAASAFPHSDSTDVIHTGLTKREYFALHLMCALKSQVDPETGNDAYTHEGAAGAAVACADELIERLAVG